MNEIAGEVYDMLAPLLRTIDERLAAIERRDGLRPTTRIRVEVDPADDEARVMRVIRGGNGEIGLGTLTRKTQWMSSDARAKALNRLAARGEIDWSYVATGHRPRTVIRALNGAQKSE